MSMKYLLIQSSIFLFLSVMRVSGIDISAEDTLHRNRRQLLFPNTTVLQFNVGIGTPTPAKMININWAFQANFNLPWNRTQIPLDILEANGGYIGSSKKKKRDIDNYVEKNERDGNYDSDGRLYHLYKHVESVLDSFGYNGTSCVLRAMCQLGAEPLHSEDDDDLLHELAVYILNPKNDNDYKEYHHEVYPYIQAYEHGENNGDCITKYLSCPVHLVDLFSMPYDL